MAVSVPSCSRRSALQRSAVGFGSLALASLMAEQAPGDSPGTKTESDDPLAAKLPMFPARAKRVIFLFMKGGPSHLDTFDPKPLLTRDDGKPVPFDKPRVQFAATGNLLKSPWSFQQYGESGVWVSELFPHMAKHVDDLCLIHSLHGTNAAHGGALLKLHTGSDNFVRPSMGSWVSYGLGTDNVDLPSFVTICPTLAHGGINNWSSAFLPAVNQGIPLGNASVPSDQANMKFLENARFSRDIQRRQLERFAAMNRDFQEQAGPESIWKAGLPRSNSPSACNPPFRKCRILPVNRRPRKACTAWTIRSPRTSAACACWPAVSRKPACDSSRSPTATAWCNGTSTAISRRDTPRMPVKWIGPIAGLLADLTSRGLLEDTLVWWGGEFGRTPVVEGTKDGRDHNPEGFTHWLAGGGVKGGFRYGSTDDYGYYAVENKVHIHDLHATILHLLGLDHEKLTYRYAGRDFRLTDVEGRVVTDLFS